MCKNVKESLIDLVMGDAIMELLETDSPISHDLLIAQLTRTLALEKRETRREAILTAINEIHKSISLIASKDKKAALWRRHKGEQQESKPQPFNCILPGEHDKKH